jgi:hypothetical protein
MSAAQSRLRRKISSLIDDPELLRISREVWSQAEANLGAQMVAGGRRLSAARHFGRACTICPRANGKVKWFFCALASVFASERQLRGLMKI